MKKEIVFLLLLLFPVFGQSYYNDIVEIEREQQQLQQEAQELTRQYQDQINRIQQQMNSLEERKVRLQEFSEQNRQQQNPYRDR